MDESKTKKYLFFTEQYYKLQSSLSKFNRIKKTELQEKKNRKLSSPNPKNKNPNNNDDRLQNLLSQLNTNNTNRQVKKEIQIIIRNMSIDLDPSWWLKLSNCLNIKKTYDN